MRLVVWLLAAVALSSPAALRAGDAQTESNERAAPADPLVGRWFNEESNKFIVFDAGGEFLDYDRGPTGGRWTNFRSSPEVTLRDKLRVSELTLDGHDPYLCQYDVVGDKLTVRNVVVQNGSARNCRLRDNLIDGSRGIFSRVKADPANPLVGKWVNRSSGSMIEFTSREEFIIHDELWNSMIPGNWAVVGAGKLRLFIGDTGNSVALICKHTISANQLTLSECGTFDGVSLRATDERVVSGGTPQPPRPGARRRRPSGGS